MGDPAGNNILKPGEIRTYIQCKPMHRHPPAAANPDCTDLSLPALYPRIDPNSCLTRRPIPTDSIIRQYPDRHLFQISQIEPDIGIEFLQVQYRVSDQLPGPVERDIPTA